MSIYKKKQTFERITIVDDMKKKDKWVQEFLAKGYRIVHIGGKSISKYKRSLTRVKIIVEKEIK